MATGGSHDAAGMARARDDGAELIGLTRPLTADPELARRLQAAHTPLRRARVRQLQQAEHP